MSYWVRLVPVCICIIGLVHPLSLTFGYVKYIDFLTTSFTNDAFVNSYYFWWIHSRYVGYFFSHLVIFSIFYFTTDYKLVITFLVYIFFEFWFVELRDSLQENSNTAMTTTITPQINLLLTNALNKYHPFIFYSSLVLVISIILNLHALFGITKVFAVNNYYVVRTSRSHKVIILNFTALYFGSWWALQEGTWGGWWNWDSSELFGLLPTLLILRLIHSRHVIWSYWLALNTSVINLYFIAAVYLLIQLNFDLIAHNFGPRFFFFFNSNLLFVIMFVFIILVSVNRLLEVQDLQVYSHLRRSQSTQFTHKNLFGVDWMLHIVPHILIYLWFMLSFWEFFDSVTTLLFSMTLFQKLTFFKVNIVLLFSLVLSFWSLKDRTFLPITISITPQPFGLLDSFTNSSSYLHLLLIVTTFSNLLIHSLTLYEWVSNLRTLYLIESSIFAWSTDYSYICDSWNIDQQKTFFDLNGKVTSFWTTANTTNVALVNLFALIITPSSLVNYYYLASSYVEISLYLYIPSLAIISCLTILITKRFCSLTAIR